MPWYNVVWLQVIPLNDKCSVSVAVNMRLEELQVLDLAWLYGCARPTLAVLYEDSKQSRHVKTYEVRCAARRAAGSPAIHPSHWGLLRSKSRCCCWAARYGITNTCAHCISAHFHGCLSPYMMDALALVRRWCWPRRTPP